MISLEGKEIEREKVAMVQKKVFESLNPTLEDHHFKLWFEWLEETGKITAVQHMAMVSGDIYFKMPVNLTLLPRRQRHKLLDDLAFTPGSPYFHVSQDMMAHLDR